MDQIISASIGGLFGLLGAILVFFANKKNIEYKIQSKHQEWSYNYDCKIKEANDQISSLKKSGEVQKHLKLVDYATGVESQLRVYLIEFFAEIYKFTDAGSPIDIDKIGNLRISIWSLLYPTNISFSGKILPESHTQAKNSLLATIEHVYSAYIKNDRDGCCFAASNCSKSPGVHGEDAKESNSIMRLSEIFKLNRVEIAELHDKPIT